VGAALERGNMERGSFQTYIDIFDEDSMTEDNAESNSDTLKSKELDDNGWFVVSEADPALRSVAKQLDDSAGECKMRKSGAAKRNTLCGYLNKCKVGSRGGCLFKRRWFVHADSSCKLLYYRTPQDIIPLGEIDIAQATLSFDQQRDISANVFRITYACLIYFVFMLRTLNRTTKIQVSCECAPHVAIEM